MNLQQRKIDHHKAFVNHDEWRMICRAACLTTSDNSACLQYLADAGMRWSYHTGAYRKLEDIISTVTGQNYTATTNSFIGNKIGMHGIWFQSVYYNKAREMARSGYLH